MSDEPDENFDPHKARLVTSPVSNWRTFLHFMKGGIGTGILAMPLAFAYTGVVVGSIFIVAVGLLCSYGINLLISTEYELCKRRKTGYLTYADAMEESLRSGPNWMRPVAKCAGITVNVFLIAYQFGICCIYVVFVSTNVKKVVDDYHCDYMNVHMYMLAFLVLFLLINCVPNLKLFAPLSGVANVFMLIGLAIICYFYFEDIPPIADRSLFGYPSKWVMFIGIALFALESVGVICATEHSMEHPEQFRGIFGIFNISIILTVLAYWFIGFFGYIRYGEEAHGTITLNLPPKSYWSEATQIIFAFCVVISYGLQCFPAIELIWSYILPSLEQKGTSAKMQLVYEYMLRIGLVLLSTGVAAAASNYLGEAIGFLGAVCLSMLGFCFPAIMHLCTFWPNKFGRFQWQLYKDILFLLVGLVIFVAGFYSVVYDIIHAGPPVSCKDM